MMMIAIAAAVNASTGATAAGTRTFSTTPSAFTACGPAATTAAPMSPPISACEEDDGRPAHHVARFHVIAPTRPAKTTGGVTAPASTMPEPRVGGTFSEMNAPAKFRTADIATATRGDIARVETDVAIAFAVSWKPFVKSKAIAVATTIQRTASECTALPILDDDARDDVHRGLRGVDRILEALEDVLPPDDHHRVDPPLEQRGDDLAQDAVALVLEPVDLHRVVVDVLERAQPGDRPGDRPGGLVQDAGHPLRLLHRRLDPVEAQEVGDLLDVVDDVVHPGGERDDVLTVERRDERLVQPLDDVVRDAVAVLLAHD